MSEDRTSDAARVPDLSALLHDIGALRTTLQTDLTLAAAALDAGADDMAGELVDNDLRALHRFSSRASGHLDALAAAEQPAPAAPVDPVVVPLARRRRLALPGAPLVAAAAAVLGFVVGVVPDRLGVEPASPELRMTSAAAASWELSRLAQAGAPAEDLRDAAEDLNDELAALIARASSDPAAAQQALLLLASSEDALGPRAGSTVLRGVLAEARALREALRERMPVVAVRRTTVRPSALVPLPELPVVQRREASPAPAEPQPDERPTAAPAPQPEPTATAAPTPQPAPTPEPEPTPESERSQGPLIPGTGDSLPGL